MKEIIGQVIRSLRKKAGLSQEALVQRSGVTKNYLSEIERGLKLPSYITMRKLAHGLRMPHSELVEKIENHAYELGNYPNSAIRKPGKERTIQVKEKDWAQDFENIRRKGQVKAFSKLSKVLAEHKDLLQNTSAEEFLRLLGGREVEAEAQKIEEGREGKEKE